MRGTRRENTGVGCSRGATVPGSSPALDRGQARFAEFDLDTETCFIGLDDDIPVAVTAAPAARPWDCVVV